MPAKIISICDGSTHAPSFQNTHSVSSISRWLNPPIVLKHRTRNSAFLLRSILLNIERRIRSKERVSSSIISSGLVSEKRPMKSLKLSGLIRIETPLFSFTS